MNDCAEYEDLARLMVWEVVMALDDRIGWHGC